MAAVLASAIMIMASADVQQKLNTTLRLERDLGLLLSILQDAETGQRGYLLTGDDAYLTPYRQALDTVGSILNRIGEEVREDDAQQERLLRVSQLSADKFQELSRTLVLVTAGRTDSLSTLLSSDLGLSLMDQIRLTIDQLRREELADVARRRQQVSRLGLVTTILQFFGVLGLATVVYYVYTYLRPHFSRILQLIADRDAEILERKRVEQLNNALIDSLNEKNRELDQFVYIASHDLREPLRTIRNYVEVLREDYPDQLDAQGQQHLALLHRTAGRMHRLIDSLLAYGRVGRGEDTTTVNLEQVAYEALENLHDAIENSDATVEIGPLPVVRGYRIALRQLLQNLLANALKFHQPGKPPRVYVTAEVEEQTARLHVRDTGIGMSAEDQATIFGLFTRLHSSETFEGQGIGLAFCQKIVHLHDGTLTVSSQPGVGSTFTVVLPGSVVHEEIRTDTPNR